MSDDPTKSNPKEVIKFLTRPYKDAGDMLLKLALVAKTRPDGSFLSDPFSTLGVGLLAERVMKAFHKGLQGEKEINLMTDNSCHAYNEADDSTRMAAFNAFIPVLASFVKAADDVDKLCHAIDRIAKQLMEAKTRREQNGEALTEDFLEAAKIATSEMAKLVNKIAHPSFIPGDDPDDDCDCDACKSRRAAKKAGKMEGKTYHAGEPMPDDVKKAVEELSEKLGESTDEYAVNHLKITLDPKKPESWKEEIDKLPVPQQVKEKILADMQAMPKPTPPTGFNVSRN